MVDRIEIETPGGRWWTVSRDLLVLRVTSCPSCRPPGEDCATIQQSDSSTMNPECADVIHSPREVQS